MATQVSVIIPTYNHRDFVMETLESVFAQTFTDYEVIVVNDGSPDDTAEVLRPYVEGGQIRYIEQPNAGQAAARNRGLVEAKGEFIAFLDDDDVWPPDKLGRQVERLSARQESALVYGTCAPYGEEPRQPWPPHNIAPSGDVRDAFLRQCWITSPGQTLIRASALKDTGGFDTKLRGTDDWDLYLRLAKGNAFEFMDFVALRYRRHSGNASNNHWQMFVNGRKVLRRHIGVFPPPRSWETWRVAHGWLANSFLRPVLEEAMTSLSISEYWRAFGLLWRVVRTRPDWMFRESFTKQLFEGIATAWRPNAAARNV